jgi:uncharacterized protein YpmB
MEYEIYYICNLLGIFLVVVIVLFHFVEADKKPTFLKDKRAAKEIKTD